MRVVPVTRCEMCGRIIEHGHHFCSELCWQRAWFRQWMKVGLVGAVLVLAYNLVAKLIELAIGR